MVQGLPVPVQFGETEINTINCRTPISNTDNEVLLRMKKMVRIRGVCRYCDNGIGNTTRGENLDRLFLAVIAMAGKYLHTQHTTRSDMYPYLIERYFPCDKCNYYKVQISVKQTTENNQH